MSSNKRSKICVTNTPGCLKTLGYVVVPCPQVMDGFCFERYLQSFCELVDPTSQVSMGSYGAIGAPSSVHSEEIRALRQNLVRIQQDVLRDIYGDEWFYQSILDRVSCRHPGTSVTAGEWHRESNISEQVKMFGGWFNMSETSQYFRGVPSTQNEPDPIGGFKKMNSEEEAKYNARAVCVEVPPKSMLIHNVLVVHQSQPSKVPKNGPSSWRIYLRCQLSRDGVSAYPMEEVLETVLTQAVPRLNRTESYFPSYSPFHVRFHRNKLMRFSENVKPAFREDGGQGLVKRHMPSLLNAGEPLFPAYTADEIAQLTPTKL